MTDILGSTPIETVKVILGHKTVVTTLHESRVSRDTKLDLPCPEWCSLKPGHDWDSEGERGDQRGHGAELSQYVGIYGIEYADTPGVIVTEISINPTAEHQVTTAEAAYQMANELVAAARWLEAHR